jgi:hypothetical protein
MLAYQADQGRLSKTMQSYEQFTMKGSIYVAEIIPRKGVLPADFVPWAPGIIVPSELLLRMAGCRSKSLRPRGWREIRCGSFCRKTNPQNYLVNRCGDFWGIERENSETLVFGFGAQPIFTRNKEDAVRLAEVCRTKTMSEYRPSLLLPMRWVPSEPNGAMWLDFAARGGATAPSKLR